MKNQRFTIPVPPSVNHYLIRTRRGSYLTQEAKDFKQYVSLTVKCDLIEGDVFMRIDIYRARAWGDIDNRDKLVLDSLQGILYHNDSQVKARLTILHDDDKKNPRIEITARELKRASS